MREIIRLLWKIRYAVYSRDLYKDMRAGRGSKENPLRVEDLAPLMKALGQIEKPSRENHQRYPSPNQWIYISLIIFVLVWGVLMLLMTFI